MWFWSGILLACCEVNILCGDWYQDSYFLVVICFASFPNVAVFRRSVGDDNICLVILMITFVL